MATPSGRGLKKQLLLPLIWEEWHSHFQTIWSPSFYSEEDYSQVEDIQNRHQSSQEFTSQQIHPKIRPCNAQEKWQITQELHLQTLRASANMWNNKVHDRTIRKIWEKYGMFGRLARKKAVAPHCRTKIQGAGLDPHLGGGDGRFRGGDG